MSKSTNVRIDRSFFFKGVGTVTVINKNVTDDT